jgi:hypothetical protein
MGDSVKILTFMVENVKRVQLVACTPSVDGLTVIGGRCGEGKSSNLDAIAWALGGDRFKPTDPVHAGADEAYVKVALSNGLIVERVGKNASLKVSGAGRGGQNLLNEFISEFALDLPKFMDARGTVRSNMLLECFPGLGPVLTKLNADIKRAYDERTALGRIAEMKAKHAQDLPFVEGVPDAPLSGTEMVGKLQAAMAVNAEHANTRRNAAKIKADWTRAVEISARAFARIGEIKKQLADAEEAYERDVAIEQGYSKALQQADAAAANLVDEDMTAVKAQLAEIDGVNAKVRQNLEKHHAEDEAESLKVQYQGATAAIEAMRAERLKLLAGVAMPLPDLSIDEDGEMIYRGRQWDGMSHSEQLRVAVAICAQIKPACGFVLADKLEALDLQTLKEFDDWLKARGLQAIATRVSTGDECSLIIENGFVADRSNTAKAKYEV